MHTQCGLAPKKTDPEEIPMLHILICDDNAAFAAEMAQRLSALPDFSLDASKKPRGIFYKKFHATLSLKVLCLY